MVFIPLSFATSFFGMNVQQLVTGPMHIGYFVLTAFLSGVIALFLSASMKPVERSIHKKRKVLAESEGENVSSVQRRDILRYSTMGRLVLRQENVGWDWWEFRPHFRNLPKLYTRRSWALVRQILRKGKFNIRRRSRDGVGWKDAATGRTTLLKFEFFSYV